MSNFYLEYSDMKFSSKSEYGLRAIIIIAQGSKEKPAAISQIAKQEKISLTYLEKIVGILKKNKLVDSDRGAKGGYYLAKPPSQINLKEVFSALEGDLSPSRCSYLQFSCNHKNCCAKKVWVVLENKIAETLEGIKLKDIL